MTTRFVSRFAVSLAAFVALAAAACSSAPPDSTLGGNDTKPKAPATKAGDDKGNTPAPSGNDTPGAMTPTTPLADDKACGAKADVDTCAKCCIDKDPAAYDAADKVYFDCVCAATACATECSASVCATADNQNQPTAACQTCLDSKGQACEDKASAACEADAKCKAIDSCLQTQCAPKQPKQP